MVTWGGLPAQLKIAIPQILCFDSTVQEASYIYQQKYLVNSCEARPVNIQAAVIYQILCGIRARILVVQSQPFTRRHVNNVEAGVWMEHNHRNHVVKYKSGQKLKKNFAVRLTFPAC